MLKPSRFLPSTSFIKQAASAGALAAASSYLSQRYVEKAEHVNYDRVLHFSAVTMALVVPIQYHWFRFLSTKIPGNSFQAALKRMAADQIMVAPILTPMFMFNVQLLDSKSFDFSLAKTRAAIFPVLMNNYKLWPMVQLINLSVVPMQYRIAFLQLVGLFWGAYVSYALGKASN